MVKCGKCDNTGVSGARARSERAGGRCELGAEVRKTFEAEGWRTLETFEAEGAWQEGSSLAPCVQNMMILVGREESGTRQEMKW